MWWLHLRTVFDANILMKEQVSNVCRSLSYHLRNIGSIRSVLEEDSAAKLVHALITSRLDYCSCLLYGISDEQINRLQRQQNNAARVIVRKRKYDFLTAFKKTSFSHIFLEKHLSYLTIVFSVHRKSNVSFPFCFVVVVG